MNYSSQIEAIANYFKNGEKNIDDFKLGVEFEHFVIDKDTLKTISYYDKDGVGETLKELVEKGWKGKYEDEYILEASKGNKTITLEPGSQLELSIEAKSKIEDMEKEYLDFLEEIIPILHEKNQALIAVSYHPETKIDEIKLLPKYRYDIMFNHFKTKGKHAHNMMKGTAALQVSIDYSSEEDYRRKYRVANALSPVLYAIFDNGFFFEGEKWENHNIRTHIWNNCDNDRSGIVDHALEDEFGYKKYAEYVLNRPPIFIMKDGEIVPTGEKKVSEIFDPKKYTTEELEHILTMFFADVRTKKYIEIRMMDSIPYPLNFAVVALIKGIFYNEKSLEKAYTFIKDITIKDVKKAKEDIIAKGLEGQFKGQSVLEIGRYLVELAKEGLNVEEKQYILPLEGMLIEGKNPYEITKDKFIIGKKNALNWCILNNLVEVRR